jgi:hypothetical protein
MDSSKAPVKLVKVKTVLGRTGMNARLAMEISKFSILEIILTDAV